MNAVEADPGSFEWALSMLKTVDGTVWVKRGSSLSLKAWDDADGNRRISGIDDYDRLTIEDLLATDWELVEGGD